MKCKRCGKEITTYMDTPKEWGLWIHKDTNQSFCISTNIAEPEDDGE